MVLLLPVVLPLLPKRKKLLLPRKRKNLTMTCLEVVSLIKSINTFHQWFLVVLSNKVDCDTAIFVYSFLCLCSVCCKVAIFSTWLGSI